MQPKKLEQHKFFPYVAWTLCILFAGFVGMLSLEMKKAVNELQMQNLQDNERISELENTVYKR